MKKYMFTFCVNFFLFCKANKKYSYMDTLYTLLRIIFSGANSCRLNHILHQKYFFNLSNHDAHNNLKSNSIVALLINNNTLN